MESTTILYGILALGLSIAVAYFQYFYKRKTSLNKTVYILSLLRGLSFFALCVLLINPKIRITTQENIKPILSVLIDNSLSMQHFNEEQTIKDWLNGLQTNKALQNKFDLKYYTYGERIAPLDSLGFTERHTDISQAITAVNNLHKDKQGAILLLGDGNQTKGNSYEYISSTQPVFPVVVGDTIVYKDVRISQLNVNKYSYIKNKFPVETFLYYDGKVPITTTFSIQHKGKTVFSQKVRFTATDNTKVISTGLQASDEGVQYYKASIGKIPDEKNIQNNLKNFSVEVLDQQTKVLLLSSILHPDLGALKKAIESNQQREVTISLSQNFKSEINDYQLVVFYQPNKNFKKWFNKRKSNYWVITGAKTSWGFLNNAQPFFRKKAISQTEHYSAVYNKDFLTFNQKDIGFESYPPLLDKFGEITIQNTAQVLCYQQFSGVASTQPLFATFEDGNGGKSAVTFGEGLWKWRAEEYRKKTVFNEFDAFIGNIVQYLASNKKRKRLEVVAERLYTSSNPIKMSAFYRDQNYQFDNRATLRLTVTETTTKLQKEFLFSVANNSYEIAIDNLPSGTYSYKVAVDGQSIQQFGRFKIVKEQIEKQFTNAAQHKLQKLALSSKGELFFKNQKESVIQGFINNSNFYTTQKSTSKSKDLIDWKWILFLIVLLLSLEWFIRKYLGKI